MGNGMAEGLLRGEVCMYTLHRRYIRNDCLWGGGSYIRKVYLSVCLTIYLFNCVFIYLLATLSIY